MKTAVPAKSAPTQPSAQNYLSEDAREDDSGELAIHSDNHLLTMQQGFDLACAEGWSRSKDSFRNWCRRNPELLESVFRLRRLDNVSRDNRSPSFERLT